MNLSQDDFSGIYANDNASNEAGVSFGKHFAERCPKIDDVLPSQGTPQKKSIPSCSIQSGLSPSEMQLSVNKWPENENTHLLGDIQNWSKYRPNNDYSINFTNIVEANTIYEKSQLLQNCRLPIDNGKFSSVNTSIGEFFSGRSADPRDLFPNNNSGDRSKQSTMAKQKNTPATIHKLEINQENIIEKPNYSSEKSHLTRKALGNISNVTTYSNNPIESQLNIQKLFTYRDEELPLKSNLSTLVWDCVQLGNSMIKSFRIKNTSEKQMSLNIKITRRDFKLVNLSTERPIILNGNEVREIEIEFCPSVSGKAFGQIIFEPNYFLGEIERRIYLCAYGGSAKFLLRGIEIKDQTFGLSLKLDEFEVLTSTRTLKGNFSIHNQGSASGAVMMFIKPETNPVINASQIFITPRKFVAAVKEDVEITVICQLQLQDVKKLLTNSQKNIAIGRIMLIFGSEPSRQRIATILNREGNNTLLHEQYGFLVNGFTSSLECYDEFRDNAEHILTLFATFRKTQIELIVNRSDL